MQSTVETRRENKILLGSDCHKVFNCIHVQLATVCSLLIAGFAEPTIPTGVTLLPTLDENSLLTEIGIQWNSEVHIHRMTL